MHVSGLHLPKENWADEQTGGAEASKRGEMIERQAGGKGEISLIVLRMGRLHPSLCSISADPLHVGGIPS